PAAKPARFEWQANRTGSPHGPIHSGVDDLQDVIAQRAATGIDKAGRPLADTACRERSARNRPYRLADTVCRERSARNRPYRLADTVCRERSARNRRYRLQIGTYVA